MKPQMTIDEITVPRTVKAANMVGRWLEKSGLWNVDLRPESLMAEAKRVSGLEDFGPDDFQEPMRIVLECLAKNDPLSPLARFATRQRFVRLLRNRLEIQRDIDRTPEIIHQEVSRPIFIVGLHRTGTTLLHNLLCQDLGARVPRTWELARPSPPPDPMTETRDFRREETRRFIKRMHWMAPGLQTIHAVSVDGPEECAMLFENSFATPRFQAYCRTPEYTEWLLTADWRPQYRYHRRQLQLLQWKKRGDHWALKDPCHLFHVDALLAAYPDACIVHTHRDPRKSIASGCSLRAAIQKMSCEQIDLQHVGRESLFTWSQGLERSMKARESLPAERFHDVHFDDLMADPIGVCRGIYERFGHVYTPEMETGMRRHLAESPRHAHGVHRYSLERFGLDDTQVENSCAGYIEALAGRFAPRRIHVQ